MTPLQIQLMSTKLSSKPLSTPLLWFDRIRGGSAPHNLALNAWDSFGLYSEITNIIYGNYGHWECGSHQENTHANVMVFPTSTCHFWRIIWRDFPKTFLPQIFGSVREKSVAPHYLAEPFSSALKPCSESEAFFCHISWRQTQGGHTRAKRVKKATPRYVAGPFTPLCCVYSDFGGICAILSGGNPLWFKTNHTYFREYGTF
jgi:hypothetical protein